MAAARGERVGAAVRAALAVLVGVIWLLPFVGVIMTSLRPYAEVVNGWWRLRPFHVGLENYRYVLSGISIPMGRPLANSFFTSILGAAFPALLGSMAAYAFVRHRIPGKTGITVVLLCLMAVPGQMIANPAFRTINAIGLLDTYGSVVLMNTVTAIPWILFFMMNVIKMQDVAIEEAAKIDGASDYWIYRAIVLPQSGPSLISVMLLQFVWSWNSFFWPLILVYDQRKLMATQVIPMLLGQFYQNWGALTAAVVLVMAIPVTLFLVFQKAYIQGSVGFISDK
jgi:multiple sugar transport system permease protein